jgi:hypothetical protein
VPIDRLTGRQSRDDHLSKMLTWDRSHQIEDDLLCSRENAEGGSVPIIKAR